MHRKAGFVFLHNRILDIYLLFTQNKKAGGTWSYDTSKRRTRNVICHLQIHHTHLLPFGHPVPIRNYPHTPFIF